MNKGILIFIVFVLLLLVYYYVAPLLNFSHSNSEDVITPDMLIATKKENFDCQECNSEVKDSEDLEEYFENLYEKKLDDKQGAFCDPLMDATVGIKGGYCVNRRTSPIFNTQPVRRGLIPSPLKLFKNNLLKRDLIFPMRFSLFFEIMPQGTNSNWTNVFRLQEKRSKSDIGKYGDRALAVWFMPNSTRLHIRMDTTTKMNQGLDLKNNLPLNQWTGILIQIIPQNMNMSLLQVRIGNSFEFAWIIGMRRRLECNLFVSDNIYIPANASVKGFIASDK